MIDKVNPGQCCLCDACVTACPTGAISKQHQVLDFFYPQIDTAKCVECQLCEKVCPVLSAPQAPAAEHTPQIIWNKDESKRRLSTSGGVFIALAEETLKNGGYVCGAVFEQDFRVRHIISNKWDDVRRMMGAKYVQSDLVGIYKQIKKLLTGGASVLFSGCPCQVAALHRFLGKQYDKLLCAEVICHGISSPFLWEKYLRMREKIHRARLRSVEFRSKKNGWHESSVRMVFDNEKEYLEPYYRDAFSGSMVKNITLKESCYQCRFKGFASGADLTLGDLWGANVEVPELDDNQGLSAVITHTERAEKMLRTLELHIRSGQLDQFIKYNPGILHSAPKSPLRKMFYNTACRVGYTAAIKKHLIESFTSRSLRTLKEKLRRLRHLCTRLRKRRKS